MYENILPRVIGLGIVAVLGIVGMQSYWVITTWDLNDTEFSQKAQLALYGVARQLAAENESDLPNRDIVRRQSSNYFIVNIESEIEAARLESLMQQELTRLGLDIPFEYAIFDCTSDQMVYGGYCGAPDEADDPSAGGPESYLAPDNNLLYFFGVKFPTRTGYIWEKMQLVVFLTIILLLTVAFFIFTVILILRQRRLAVLQKDFIDNMTHEFKTPLSTIRIAAGVFRRDDYVRADGRLSRYADLIHQQYERLNEQVEKVLNISRIEKGSLKIVCQDVDLNRILPDLLRGTQAQIDHRSGHLALHLPPGPLCVYADPVHLSNILANLLDNAVKYGGTPPSIMLSGEIKRGLLSLRVRDNGPGIPAEHRERLFEKFYRIPTGDVHDVKGFGLGLFYVAQICRAHGFTIGVTCPPEGGSIFTLEMPLRAVPKPVTT